MKFEKRTIDSRIVNLKDTDAGTIVINGDKFTGTREINGKEGPFTTYLFESDEGEVTSISATGQLKYKIEQESDLQIGERVQLTYLGKAPVKGRQVHQFQLLVAVAG